MIVPHRHDIVQTARVTCGPPCVGPGEPLVTFTTVHDLVGLGHVGLPAPLLEAGQLELRSSLLQCCGSVSF